MILGLNDQVLCRTQLHAVGYNHFGVCDNKQMLDKWSRHKTTGPCSPVVNVSGYRYVSDCRSRGRQFDPGPVPYFRGDWSWNNFYGHSPPFRWFHSRRVVVSYKRKYVHKLLVNHLFKPAQEKSVVKWTDHPAMTIAVDLGRKATKTNKQDTKPSLRLILDLDLGCLWLSFVKDTLNVMANSHVKLWWIWPTLAGDMARTQTSDCNSFWPSLSQKLWPWPWELVAICYA